MIMQLSRCCVHNVVLRNIFWFLIPDCQALIRNLRIDDERLRLPPVAYPELVSRGFPKFANLSGWLITLY